MNLPRLTEWVTPVWKWIDRYTLIGLLVFSTSAVITGSRIQTLLNQVVSREVYWSLPNEVLTQMVCLGFLLVGSFLVLSVRSATTFRVVIGGKVLFLLLLLVTVRSMGTVELGLSAVLLAELCLYEAFFLNLVLAFVFLAAFESAVAAASLAGDRPWALSDLWGPMLGPQLPGAAVLLLVVLISGLLTYYRERCVGLDQRIRQLDAVIERLSVTNLGYKNYAHEAAAKSQTEERLRISRELHDVVGYTFTNNIMMMEAAITKIQKDPDRVRMLIDLARENAQAGYEKIRQALYVLRKNEVRKTPTLERILKMIEIFQVATQITVRTDFTNTPAELPPEREEFFYHFVQESLTNAFLHGAATRIDVIFFQTDRGISASVSDNGVGGVSFQEGIGIRGMRERLDPLGGSLEIRSHGRGFELLVEVPWEASHG